MTASTPNATYTLSEAARWSGRSRVTIRRYLDGGRFPGATKNLATGVWYIPEGDLVAAGLAAASHPTTASPDDLALRLAVAEAVAEERLRTIEVLERLVNELTSRPAR